MVGYLNILGAAAVAALIIPGTAGATPLDDESRALGGLPGETADSLLFDSAGASFAPSSSSVAVVPAQEPFALTTRPDPLTLVSSDGASGTTTLPAVPLPAGVWLLLAGLLPLSWLARRRKAA